jgi:hypothetical protein
MLYCGHVCDHWFKFGSSYVHVAVRWRSDDEENTNKYYSVSVVYEDDWRGVLKLRLDDAILWFSSIVSHINKLPADMNPTLDDLGLHENAGVVTLAV